MTPTQRRTLGWLARATVHAVRRIFSVKPRLLIMRGVWPGEEARPYLVLAEEGVVWGRDYGMTSLYANFREILGKN